MNFLFEFKWTGGFVLHYICFVGNWVALCRAPDERDSESAREYWRRQWAKLIGW